MHTAVGDMGVADIAGDTWVEAMSAAGIMVAGIIMAVVIMLAAGTTTVDMVAVRVVLADFTEV